MSEQLLTPLITVENVYKHYHRGSEDIQVLDNLSLTVNEGEFLALMGPSGSGKTTLLNLMAGLDRTDRGQLQILGTNLSELNESQLGAWRAQHIGIIFQFYNLIPVLTAQENVSLPLSLLKIPAAERKSRATYALELVGLADRLDHFPSQLSGGQEQRVAIARAIVTDPEVIIADEPTGDLDRQSASEVLQLLQVLNRNHKKTIIMVTHDPHAAEYASRIVRLDKGQLDQVQPNKGHDKDTLN